MPDQPLSHSPRLRVFAGPNGSGKSTIIKAVQNTIINDREINFGSYINADDIAASLLKNEFSFRHYRVTVTKIDFLLFARSSGLLTEVFNEKLIDKNVTLTGDHLQLTSTFYYQEIAQLLARYLRERMLRDKISFTFETVFSHSSNLDIMRKAVEAGYKVYLYFVSTASPEINQFRVQYRVTQGGHDVPADKIRSRYYRSLELLYDAAEIACQCFFFDNSKHDAPFRLINHFKRNGVEKVWDTENGDGFTEWFKKYYWNKQKT